MWFLPRPRAAILLFYFCCPFLWLRHSWLWQGSQAAASSLQDLQPPPERRFLQLIGPGGAEGRADVRAGPGFVRAAISSLSVFSMLHIILVVSHQLWPSMLDTLTDYAPFG